MKINCVLIGLILCFAGCGGGGGSSHGDDVTVPAPAMIQFTDRSTVLGEDKYMSQLMGCCGHLLRRIGKIIWRSTPHVIILILRAVINPLSLLRDSLTTNPLLKFWVI